MPKIEIEMTPAQAKKFAYSLGRVQGLLDEDKLPRDATKAECRDYVVERMRQIVRKCAKDEARAAAEAAEPEFDL